MIAGGYALDLYCDSPKPWTASKTNSLIDAYGHRYNEFPHQYTAELGSQCRADAKKDGWKFTRDGRVLCPKCNLNRKVLP